MEPRNLSDYGVWVLECIENDPVWKCKKVYLNHDSGFTYLPLWDSSLQVPEILTAYSSLFLSFSFGNTHYETEQTCTFCMGRQPIP